MTMIYQGIGDEVLHPLAREVERQDRVQALAADRDGLRLALACMEDELREARESWDGEKRRDGWEETELELQQLGALVLRTLRAIRMAAGSR